MGRAAKFLTALAGAGAQIISQGLVDGAAAAWLGVAVGVLTAAAVYLVPNTPQAAIRRPSLPWVAPRARMARTTCGRTNRAYR